MAEVAARIEGEFTLNVQGDEPFLHPLMLSSLWESFRTERTAVFGTLWNRISSEKEPWNPNVVKVATDSGGCPLYFSRFAIPCREPNSDVAKIDGGGRLWYKHEGI